MEDPQHQQSPSKPSLKKTACAECRQQKMRCDGDPGTLNPCSRCSRLKISCVYSAPFTRTHKRKRMEELEEENAALKRQLTSASIAAPAKRLPSGDALLPQEEAIDGLRNPVSSKMRRSGPSATSDPTMSRTIDGIEVPSSIIDGCFDLYFKDYHYLLPILDPGVTPNSFYQHTPFLFWVIVSIGSRRYTRQPTLTQTLARPVTDLVLRSIIIRAKPIERIKALLLFLHWPFPSGPFYRDPSFLLAGSMLHIAMHCGLHATAFSHDFFGSYSKLPEQDLIQRMEIWAYVVVAYQRTGSGTGRANLFSFEIYNEKTQSIALMERLPMTLRLQIQISSIITRAHRALLDLGIFSMIPQQERTMDTLLKGFNTELDGLESLAMSEWDRLHVASARQNLVVMHFYKSATTLDMQASMLIFNATSSVLEQVRNLDRDYGLHNTCTRFMQTVVLLALSSIARILKGPFTEYLDQTRGHELIEFGVHFARSSSIQKGDFGDKCAQGAEQMWKSKKVFRNPDGSINITLRVRNRLSTSPWHDAIRCWREEFIDPDCMHTAPENIENVLPSSSSSSTARIDANLAPSPAPNDNQFEISTAPEFSMSDELWGDLGIGLIDEWDVSGLDTSWMT